MSNFTGEGEQAGGGGKVAQRDLGISRRELVLHPLDHPADGLVGLPCAALELEVREQPCDAQGRRRAAHLRVGGRQRLPERLRGVRPPSRDSHGRTAGSRPPGRRSAAVARRGCRPGRRRPRAAARSPRLAEGRRAVAGLLAVGSGRQRHAQHPQHHVGRLEAAAGLEEGASLIADHRPVDEAPEQRAALLHVLIDRVRAGPQPVRHRALLEPEVEGVDGLPHLRRDHVAQAARPLPAATHAGDDRGGVGMVESEHVHDRGPGRRPARARGSLPRARRRCPHPAREGGRRSRPAARPRTGAARTRPPLRPPARRGRRRRACGRRARRASGRGPARTARRRSGLATVLPESLLLLLLLTRPIAPKVRSGSRGGSAEAENSTGRDGRASSSSSTQVSFDPPPWEELTIIDPSRSATRVSPPGTIRCGLP